MARKNAYLKRKAFLDRLVAGCNAVLDKRGVYGFDFAQRNKQRMMAFATAALNYQNQVNQSTATAGAFGIAGNTSASTATGTNHFVVFNAITGSSTGTVPVVQGGRGGILNTWYIDDGAAYPSNQNLQIAIGIARTIYMPDGTRIEVAANGSFKIIDKDAKVTYRANRVRNFNKFLNVSDRLEEFIKFCGEHGVRSGEMMALPIELFIGWLCIKAAEADDEPAPDIKLIPDLRRQVAPKCPSCGKFVSPARKAKRIEFCKPQCFERHYARISAA